jgi:hypothetical protein
MIASTDIANILYRDCKVFGIEIVPFGKTLTGELKGERITIHVKKPETEKYWEKCFVEVNLCVPNLRKGEANTVRLNELERIAKRKFKPNTVDKYDGSTYLYSGNTSIEADASLKCHFVNCKILFNVLNVK